MFVEDPEAVYRR